MFRHSMLFVCLSALVMPVPVSALVFELPENHSAAPEPEAVSPAPPETAGTSETVSAPEVPEIPLEGSTPIMGKGKLEKDRLLSFLLNVNKDADPALAAELAGLYIEEAGAEGVNHDVAYAQMCLETGFLRYGGLVTADMNNFCGLGALGPEHPGERFSSPRTGVRAHIQHLKAYASGEALTRDLVDPRYPLVRKGSAPLVKDLAGTWAADTNYGTKIEIMLLRLYEAGTP